MKKRNIYLIVSIILLITIIIFLVYNNNINKSKLVKINLDKVEEKINNKDTFILCVSSSTCINCERYLPKLEEISRDYNLEIFYIEVDKLSSKELTEFKNVISFDDATPVTLFIKNGVENTASNRIFGNVSSDKIIEKFKKNGFIK